MQTLIKNGTVVTEEKILTADVLIEDEKIKTVEKNLPATGVDEIIDAEGLYVLPGGIDVHTHLDLDVGATVSADDFYTGHVAAAFGGTTTHIDFATPAKGETLRSAYEEWLGKADGKAVIDYGFHMSVVEVNESILREMEQLPGWGITSIKVYMAYKNILQLTDEEIFRVMQVAARKNILAAVHAENGDVIDFNVKSLLRDGKTEPKYHALSRPPLLEAEATHRAIYIANAAGANVYIVHVTAEMSLAQIVESRKRGLKVLAETCPHYLMLDDSYLEFPDFEGAKYICSPPLRKKSDNEALWKGLSEEDLQIVSTDHCPFNFKGQKDLGKDAFNKIPNGLPGLEERIPILFSEGVAKGKISLAQFVKLTATNPAKIFGLYPRKGVLKTGADADVYLLNPNAERTISVKTSHGNLDYNPYEGLKIKGKIEKVFRRGKLIVDGERFLGEKGSGIYLHRSSPIVD